MPRIFNDKTLSPCFITNNLTLNIPKTQGKGSVSRIISSQRPLESVSPPDIAVPAG